MACVLGTAAGASSEGDLWQGRSHRQVSRVQEHTTGGEIPASGRRGNPEGPPTPVRAGPPSGPATQWQTTGVLTAAMIAYALGAGITAAAGTRLALQLILITVFGLHPFQVPPTESRQDCCGSSLPHRGVCTGQFARLLPTLVVVAVSQAPSPESNPNSPLLVRAIVVHYTTITADKSEVRAIKRFPWHEATTLPAQAVPGGPA